MVKLRVGVMAALLAATLLPACSGSSESGERATVGTNYVERVDRDRVVADADHRSSLDLPTGRLLIGVDGPLSELAVDDPDSNGTVKLRAPRDGTFVRVSWDLESSNDEVIAGAIGLEDRPRSFDTISVLGGGQRYLLGTGDAGSRDSAVWTVPGNGKDLQVEVAYDGVVQRVDARTGKRTVGRAASLYDRPAPRRGDCGSPRFVAPFAAPSPTTSEPGLTCKYEVRRVGYVSGTGWAPAGKSFLVVDLLLPHEDELTLLRGGRAGRYQVRDDDDLTARVSGVDSALARGVFGDDAGGHALTFVLPSTASLPQTVTVTQQWSVIAVADLNKSGRVRQHVDLAWTVPLR